MAARNQSTNGVWNLGSSAVQTQLKRNFAVLLAYDASVVLKSKNKKRELKLKDFIKGYRATDLKEDEIISKVIIPKAEDSIIVKSYKVSKRRELDISTVSAGLMIKLNADKKVIDARFYYGGMAAYTKSAANVENKIKGKIWNRENVENAMKSIKEDFTPLSDARAGAEVRNIIAENLLLKFWSETK